MTACSIQQNSQLLKEESGKEVRIPQIPIATKMSEAMAVKTFPELPKYCKKIDKKFLKYGWGKSHCENFNWEKFDNSVNGDPLIWTKYGEDVRREDTEVTYILCGVHGDEITPIKLCFDILNHLEEIKMGKVINSVTGMPENFKGKQVVVTPIVNPDSFFKKRPTRTNANGIDVNRNFPTKDFTRDAIKLWKTRYGEDKRRYPGLKAMSEPEVAFQVEMIKRFGPHKIISVHAPLTMLDYDGPSDRDTGGVIGPRANQLLIKMSERAKHYRVKNYPFFPGSLGNYAGNERNIPTYTLELPSSDNRKSRRFWMLFKDSIHSAIMHKISEEIDVAFDSHRHN